MFISFFDLNYSLNINNINIFKKMEAKMKPKNSGFMTDVLKPFSHEETIYYFQLLKEGNQEAKNKLIEHNLRFVFYIVNNFSNMENQAVFDKEDLISIGSIGLIKAIETFDIKCKNKFATYAAVCIKNEILMFLRKNQKRTKDISLEIPLNIDYDGNVLRLFDVISNDVSLDEAYLKIETYNEIWKAIKSLNEREQQIIILKYGLNGTELTQKQIAEKLGLSQSYISRIERKILIKIKEIFKKRGYIMPKKDFNENKAQELTGNLLNEKVIKNKLTIQDDINNFENAKYQFTEKKDDTSRKMVRKFKNY